MFLGNVTDSSTPNSPSYTHRAFAQAVCAGEDKALSEFLQTFSDQLYYIAARFNNRGISRDYWEYKTGKGKSIRVNDDVADTYVWLIEVAMKKSCLYRGDRGASFSTYITSVLNSDFIFKDWLRWKTGVTGYVPKSIKGLGNQHISVFNMLRQKKEDHDICFKLKIDISEYLDIYEEIESALIKAGQIDLLEKPKFVSTGQGSNPESGFDIEDRTQLDPASLLDVEHFQSFLEAVVDKLDDHERRLLLLYWTQGLSIEEIFSLLSGDDFGGYFNKLSIDSPQKIYQRIDLLSRKCLRIATEDFPDMIETYSINTSTMRRLLRLYFNDWQPDE